MALRSLVGRLLPRSARTAIGNLLVERRERRLSRLSLPDAFDEIYKSEMWKQGEALSGVGSEGALAEQYASLVRDYAKTHGLRTAVDGGCGDFSVGARLADGFTSYTALDVSPRIIEINRRKFTGKTWEHVSFGVADMTRTRFPSADLILIRQVLQHLTNEQIEMILRNLEQSHWRRALISEDVDDPDNNAKPNVDLPSHSVRTRRAAGSGVFIDRPPFNRAATRIATLYPAASPGDRSGGILVMELVNER